MWGNFAKEHGLLFIVDASQTAGVFPIDITALKIDVLCSQDIRACWARRVRRSLRAEGVAIRPWKGGLNGIKTFDGNSPPAFRSFGGRDPQRPRHLSLVCGGGLIFRVSDWIPARKGGGSGQRFYKAVSAIGGVTV
jgi:hypothetical protein